MMVSVGKAAVALTTGGISGGLLLHRYRDKVKEYFEGFGSTSVPPTTRGGWIEQGLHHHHHPEQRNLQVSDATAKLLQRHMELRELEHKAELVHAKAIQDARWEASIDAVISERLDTRLARQVELAGQVERAQQELATLTEQTEQARATFDRLVCFHSELARLSTSATTSTTSFHPFARERAARLASQVASEVDLRQFTDQSSGGGGIDVWNLLVGRLLAALAIPTAREALLMVRPDETTLSVLARFNQATGWSRVLLKPAILELRRKGEAEYVERLFEAKVLMAKHQWRKSNQ